MSLIGIDCAQDQDEAHICVFQRDADGGLQVVTLRQLVRRTVSARRARTLRRAGRRCIYVGRTSTGKARFAYMAQVAAAKSWRHRFDQAGVLRHSI
jgi:hypothetical protein